jgi:hypothetical protein
LSSEKGVAFGNKTSFDVILYVIYNEYYNILQATTRPPRGHHAATTRYRVDDA